jgi:phytoene dehydrogenase-like protein
MKLDSSDVAIVGSGPNGIAAAIVLAEAGFKPKVFEMYSLPGGGLRTEELTIPGFHHDVCSGIYPLGRASPFYRSLNLKEYGLDWINSPIELAHPFDDGTAAALYRSIDQTIQTLNLLDRNSYRKLLTPFVNNWEKLTDEILSPIHLPRHRLFVKFGMYAVSPASILINTHFKQYRAKALFAGMCAHSFLNLKSIASSAVGLMLGTLGHAVGWPLVKGGSQCFTNATIEYLHSLGGEYFTNTPIKKIKNLLNTQCVLLDVTPRQLLKIIPEKNMFLNTLYKRFKYGPSVFKIDWALNSPIPWKSPECGEAGTVHVGGTFEEIENSEKEVTEGVHPEFPFVLVSQQSLFDSSRAPEGKHTGWAYCHVPFGSAFDMTERIEKQIERFAPGFRDCIIARHTRNTVQLEQYNPNLVGGDINGGSLGIFQLLLRPIPRRNFYSTGVKNVFLCSSSTPPGPGVHGMCGYHGANAALRMLEKVSK